MCPLRLILVFLSATLAGYFAWKSIRSTAPSPISVDAAETKTSVDDSRKERCFDARKVIGDGFWVFVDMASGRYLWRAMKERGSNDGDLCVVEVKKMEISHWSKKLHLGTCISSIEFCPTERVVVSTSNQWGAVVTKLSVPADWKEWQLYLVLLGLFLASAVLFYVFYENSDSFWNFPLGRNQHARPSIEAFVSDPQFPDDQGPW